MVKAYVKGSFMGNVVGKAFQYCSWAIPVKRYFANLEKQFELYSGLREYKLEGLKVVKTLHSVERIERVLLYERDTIK